MYGSPSQRCSCRERRTARSTESSVPPGWKKYRKTKPMATPLMRYGKNRMPLKRFRNRVLKLRTVAKYSASAICTTEAPR